MQPRHSTKRKDLGDAVGDARGDALAKVGQGSSIDGFN